MQMTDIVPLIIIAAMVLIAIIFIRKMTSESVEVYEEPNPEYLEQLAIGRTNFLNEVLEHLRLVFVLSDDEIKSAVVETVGDQIHRITVAAQDQIFTILLKWDKTMTISCFHNQKIKGQTLIWTRKTFRVSYNCVNWKKVDKFFYKTLDKFMAVGKSSEDFKILLTAALEVAQAVEDKTARELLYEVAIDFPFDGKKLKSRDAVRMYTSLLAYVVKYHKEEFVAYLNNDEDSE